MDIDVPNKAMKSLKKFANKQMQEDSNAPKKNEEVATPAPASAPAPAPASVPAKVRAA